MNCLILAAGYGSRLQALGPSKPLVEVGGVPLIEHVVRSAATGGAEQFTVVIGHEAERVEAFLAELSERSGMPIEAVRLADWDRPNGLSVVAGAERLSGDYLLMMADHLFDPDIVRQLVASPRVEGLRLAVDRQLSNPFVDLEDVTKVETADGGRIVRIGKAIAQYDAFDTGVFLATPALRTAILEALNAGLAGSLSDGVQRLADQGLAWTLDASGSWWADVDDPSSHAAVEAELCGRQG